MSNKITVVVGHKTTRPERWESMSVEERLDSDWKAESFHRSGFWKTQTISDLARKLGFVGDVKVAHACMDYSGKGRTYNVREEIITL